MGLENVFLSALPIVESLARSTMWSSTTFFSNSRKVQRARPLGGLEQARAISLASFSPSKIRRNRRCRPLLAAQHRLEALFHQLFPHPVNHGNAGVQSLDNPAVTPAFTGFRDIGLQQYPRLEQLLSRALAFPYQRLKLLALLATQPHNILLYRNLLGSHHRLPRSVATESNHKKTVLSN